MNDNTKNTLKAWAERMAIAFPGYWDQFRSTGYIVDGNNVYLVDTRAAHKFGQARNTITVKEALAL